LGCLESAPHPETPIGSLLNQPKNKSREKGKTTKSKGERGREAIVVFW